MFRDVFLICFCACLAFPPVSADAARSSSKNPCQVQTAEKVHHRQSRRCHDDVMLFSSLACVVCLSSWGLQDKGFVIGLAYWPGGTAADWGNSSEGLNPCSPDAGGLVRPIGLI